MSRPRPAADPPRGRPEAPPTPPAAGDAPAPAFCVAHFRRSWFAPSETFLHNTIRACRSTRPLLVGYTRVNADAFPVDGPVLALYPPGSWAERELALRVRLLGPRGHPRFARRRTFAALRRHDARVLHAHFGHTGWQVLSVRRRTGLPLVTTFYGHDVSRQARNATWGARFRELFAEGDLFLVEGPHMRERLAEIGCPPEKSAIQRIAVRTALYPFRARKPVGRGEPVRVFFCARFREKKGLPDALEAFARARATHPRLVLRIAGDGPQRAELEALAARLGLSGHAHFLGPLAHPRMIEEMDAADVFLQPSLTAADGDSEGGAPTTLLEAQACGLPVVATRHADIPYVAPEGEGALLADERDVEGLAAHLATLADEPERWAALGAAGRAHVERFHDADREVARLEARYRVLAGVGVAGGAGDAA